MKRDEVISILVIGGFVLCCCGLNLCSKNPSIPNTEGAKNDVEEGERQQCNCPPGDPLCSCSSNEDEQAANPINRDKRDELVRFIEWSADATLAILEGKTKSLDFFSEPKCSREDYRNGLFCSGSHIEEIPSVSGHLPTQFIYELIWNKSDSTSFSISALFNSGSVSCHELGLTQIRQWSHSNQAPIKALCDSKNLKVLISNSGQDRCLMCKNTRITIFSDSYLSQDSNLSKTISAPDKRLAQPKLGQCNCPAGDPLCSCL